VPRGQRDGSLRLYIFYITYINSVRTSQETQYITVFRPGTLTTRPQRQCLQQTCHILLKTSDHEGWEQRARTGDRTSADVLRNTISAAQGAYVVSASQVICFYYHILCTTRRISYSTKWRQSEHSAVSTGKRLEILPNINSH
jgi:hypothetical protein